MAETEVQIKPDFHASWDVVRTLETIGNRIPIQCESPLIVGYFHDAGDYPRPSFSFYYLAEIVITKLLGLIPRTKKRVLVSMFDPSRDYENEVGCTVLDRRIETIVDEEVRKYALIRGAEKVTILTDDKPLLI